MEENNNVSVAFIISPLSGAQICGIMCKMFLAIFWFLFIGVVCAKTFAVQAFIDLYNCITHFNEFGIMYITTTMFICIAMSIVIILAIVNIIRYLYKFLKVISGNTVYINNKVEGINFYASVRETLQMFNIDVSLATCIGRKQIKLMVYNNSYSEDVVVDEPNIGEEEG